VCACLLLPGGCSPDQPGPPPPKQPAGDPGRGPSSPVTRENYDRLATGMGEEDVRSLLGQGTLIREAGFIVEKDGGYTKYERGPGIDSRETGSTAPPGSQTRIEREVMWGTGPRTITATFVNGRPTKQPTPGLD